MKRRIEVSALALATLASLGCARGCTSSRPPIHAVPNMDYQEKLQPQEESAFFYDGVGMRQPVAGTVFRGALERDAAFLTGKAPDGSFLGESPLPVTDAVLERGAQRYSIYCQPCHDPRGTGTGILFEYGGVPTASFHDEQRRAYPAGRVFDVITNGSGLMSGYAWPIPPADRWAIVAHVRRLQEQRAQSHVAALPPPVAAQDGHAP